MYVQKRFCKGSVFYRRAVCYAPAGVLAKAASWARIGSGPAANHPAQLCVHAEQQQQREQQREQQRQQRRKRVAAQVELWVHARCG